MNYADRLAAKIAACGNPSVLGLDPRLEQIPRAVQALADSRATGAVDRTRRAIAIFHEMVIEAAQGLVPAVKLQLAFYEVHGIAGMQAYLDTAAAARAAGLLVIADGKRNDVQSTAEAYAKAFLDPEAEFAADALTISPYLGSDSIEPFAVAAARCGGGLYVLVKTSNPGSGEVQDLVIGNTTIYERVSDMVERLGRPLIGESGLSSIGAVVGCTHRQAAQRLRQRLPATPFLVPGYGAQGGTAEDAATCFDGRLASAIVNASRAVTNRFPDPAAPLEALGRAVRDNIVAMRDDLIAALPGRR